MKASTKRKLLLFLSLLFLAAVAGLYAYLYLIPNITGALTPTAVVSYGKIQTMDEEDAVVVRSEEVVYAEHDGSITYYSQEAERTRKASKILDIYPVGGSAEGYTAKETAFISYYVDGLEESLQPETIAQIDIQKMLEEPVVPSSVKRAEARSGEPLYKVITSNVWYTVLFVDQSKKDMYRLGQSLTLYFGDEGDQKLKGTVSEFYDRGDYRLVVVKIDHWYQDFAKLRSLHISLLTQDYEGLVVPNTAIAYEMVEAKGDAPAAEMPGVYVLGISGDYTFKTIDIIVANEEETLIKTDGNVKIYDEILRNAQQ